VPARLAHHFASGHERFAAQFRRQQPDQAPGQRFFQRAAGKRLFLGGHEDDDSAGVVDRPIAVTAARSPGIVTFRLRETEAALIDVLPAPVLCIAQDSAEYPLELPLPPNWRRQ
jgi:hypothetical protein